MTEEQILKLVREKINECPLLTVGQIALLKISEAALLLNNPETTLTLNATLLGKKYKCKMVVTQEEL